MRTHESPSLFDAERVSILELKLEQISSQLEVENKLHEPIWRLGRSKSGKARKLDFTPLRENVTIRQFWVDNFDLNIEYFVKEAILSDATKSKLNQKNAIGKMLRLSLRNILLMLSYAAGNYTKKSPKGNVAMITRDNFAQFIAFILVNDWKNGEVSPRSKSISFHTYQRRLPLESWKNYLRGQFITNLIDLDLSQTDERRALRKAFTSIKTKGQTFSDWKSGNNLNSLTLDIGQYYVEHCLQVFNSNSPIIASMLRAIDNRVDIGLKLNCSIEFASSPRWKTICEQLICGLTPKESILNGYKKIDLVQAYNLLNKSYAFHIESLMASSSLTSKENIDFIATKLGIENNIANRDALSIFIDLSEEKKLDGLEHILVSRFPKTSLKKLASSIEIVKLKIIRTLDVELPTLEGWKNAGFDLETAHSQRRKTLNQLVDSTIAAGTVACLAFTGWRASEFSFSMGDIKLEANMDVLDQQAFPFRIHVNSLIPKTHGYSLKQKREITHPIYKLLKNISLITTKNQNELIFQTPKLGTFSPARIYFSSSYLWTHFATFYPPFRELDEIAKSKRIAFEQEQINHDAMMLRAYTQVRNELPRVSLFLSKFERRTDLRYGKSSLLWQYKNSTLSTDKKEIFDCFLTRRTKEKIYNLHDSKSIDTEITRTVYQELVDGCAYPSPHAFRHMWAEAVYRRFDGDIGWMIRSNFKHVSKGMWHSYIRSKNYASLDQMAKSSFKSSVVHRILYHQSADFTGQFVTRVRRLFRRSKIEDPKSLNLKIYQFCENEITDIKATPWGYCMMMRRKRHRSKCSVNETPQQHRATPKLCLTCQNHLANSDNVDYIILHIAKDIEIIGNELVPIGYRRASFSALKSAKSYITNLKPAHPILDVINQKMFEFLRERGTHNV